MNAVTWFESYGTNMARARAFYQTVFNITLEELKTTDGMKSSWRTVRIALDAAPQATATNLPCAGHKQRY